jgi:hypothetical protein
VSCRGGRSSGVIGTVPPSLPYRDFGPTWPASVGRAFPVNQVHTSQFFDAHIPLTPFSVPNPRISDHLAANRRANWWAQ